VQQLTLVLTRQDVARLLGMAECIEAVEQVFRLHAAGGTIPPSVLGVHLVEGGFHIKTAGLTGNAHRFAAKITPTFPAIRIATGFPPSRAS